MFYHEPICFDRLKDFERNPSAVTFRDLKSFRNVFAFRFCRFYIRITIWVVSVLSQFSYFSNIIDCCSNAIYCMLYIQFYVTLVTFIHPFKSTFDHLQTSMLKWWNTRSCFNVLFDVLNHLGKVNFTSLKILQQRRNCYLDCRQYLKIHGLSEDLLRLFSHSS